MTAMYKYIVYMGRWFCGNPVGNLEPKVTAL